MLAKEIKIKTLKKQREFIEQEISTKGIQDNAGNTSYIYAGHVFPEVIEYFEKEGFIVEKVKNQQLPLYLFVVGDIKLTEEELKEAEAYDEAKNYKGFLEIL